MLEHFIGSIKAYFYGRFPVSVYEKSLPESIKVPSMYIPQPNILHLPHTKEGYQINYTLNIQILERDTPTAIKVAEDIAHSIRQNKNIIPLIDENGNSLGEIIFNLIESERIEDGIAQVRLDWDYSYKFN